MVTRQRRGLVPLASELHQLHQTLGGVMEFLQGCVFGLVAFGIPALVSYLS